MLPYFRPLHDSAWGNGRFQVLRQEAWQALVTPPAGGPAATWRSAVVVAKDDSALECMDKSNSHLCIACSSRVWRYQLRKQKIHIFNSHELIFSIFLLKHRGGHAHVKHLEPVCSGWLSLWPLFVITQPTLQICSYPLTRAFTHENLRTINQFKY